MKLSDQRGGTKCLVGKDTGFNVLENGNFRVHTKSDKVVNSLKELDGIFYQSLSKIIVEVLSEENFSYSIEEMQALRSRKTFQKPVEGLLLYVQKKGKTKKVKEDDDSKEYGDSNSSSRFFRSKNFSYHYSYRSGKNRGKYIPGQRRMGNLKNQKLEEGIRKYLNELTPRKYDYVRIQFFSLLRDLETGGGSETGLIARCIYEYATRELNDMYDLLARLCHDLIGYFDDEHPTVDGIESVSSKFRGSILNSCQREFNSYISLAEEEEEENEKPKENKSPPKRDSKKKKKKKRKGARENLLFISSLYEYDVIGEKIVVLILKQMIFRIYGLKSQVSVQDQPNLRGSKLKIRNLHVLEDFCTFWDRIGLRLKIGTMDVIYKFKSKSVTLIQESPEEGKELIKIANSVDRQYKSLVAFVLFLLNEEKVDIPNYHREICRKLYSKLTEEVASTSTTNLMDRRRKKQISQWEKDLEEERRRNNATSQQQKKKKKKKTSPGGGGGRSKNRKKTSRGDYGEYNKKYDDDIVEEEEEEEEEERGYGGGSDDKHMKYDDSSGGFRGFGTKKQFFK